MSSHKPTFEQQEIIDRAVDTMDSFIISALAGTAKTTTLEMIATAVPVQPILSIAFTKTVADTMTKRLPGHCLARTINSIGHRAWQPVVSKRLILEQNKTRQIVRGIIDNLPRAKRNKGYDVMYDIIKAVGRAKLAGYVPPDIGPHAKRLTEDLPEAIVARSWDDETETDEFEDFTWVVDVALQESIKQSYAGIIDYDDQIYMPTLFGGQFPRFKLVLIDEVQDLSPLNHAMLDRLVVERLIAVGDDFQSMYGFRGAMRGGMSKLKQRFNLDEKGLSISFRCPRSVIRRAWFRAPHMKWPDWAREGNVEELEGWGPRSIPDGSAIICRTNAPLFKTALALLRQGRGVHMVGFDIGPGLVRALKRLSPDGVDLSQTELLTAIDRWESNAIDKAADHKEDSIADRAQCLRCFAENGDSLAAAVAYAEAIFKVRGPIQLLSGHKAKGLEWDTVFHLDPWRADGKLAKTDEDLEQELNIRYVIETRPRDSLLLVNSEDFDA